MTPAASTGSTCLLEGFQLGLSQDVACSAPGTSIGVDLTPSHLKQLLREPRRIEILGKKKIPHFQSEVPCYRRLYDPLFSSERTGKPPKTFATRTGVRNGSCSRRIGLRGNNDCG